MYSNYTSNAIDDFADIDTTGVSDEDLVPTLHTVDNGANVPTEIAHTEEIVTTPDNYQCAYVNNVHISDDASAAASTDVVSVISTIADKICKESEHGEIHFVHDVLYPFGLPTIFTDYDA